MTSPILSTGTFIVMIRGAYGPSRAGASMASSITSRIVSRASRACCSAAASTDGGDAVELGVELQRGDELARAGDLEVHVTEGVLGTEDVGQRRRTRLAVDLPEIRPIAMPATGARSGTPALSRPSVDAQTEPIDVEPLEPSASDTCRIA